MEDLGLYTGIDAPGPTPSNRKSRIAAERDIQLPLRDTKVVDKRERQEEADVAQARELRREGDQR